jgi:hypothetical protein
LYAQYVAKRTNLAASRSSTRSRPLALWPKQRLATIREQRQHHGVQPELPIDRGDVVAILEALFDINRKLDRILELLGDDEAEEA